MELNCLLTVAPESLWLGFYILEVDTKILPRGLSGTGHDDNQHKNRAAAAVTQNIERLTHPQRCLNTCSLHVADTVLSFVCLEHSRS